MGAAIVDVQCRLACPPKSECGPGVAANFADSTSLSPDGACGAGRDKMRPDRARIVDSRLIPQMPGIAAEKGGAFVMALFSKAGALLDSLSPSMARKYGGAKPTGETASGSERRQICDIYLALSLIFPGYRRLTPDRAINGAAIGRRKNCRSGMRQTAKPADGDPEPRDETR